MNLLDHAIVTLSAFGGLLMESTTRGYGWRFLDIGRRLERALQMTEWLRVGVSGAAYQGADASHAWVSVFIPGAGWLDFDPTNDVRPGEGHVTLGWGRDYGDATPVKGIALGGGKQIVEVEVRVAPMETPAEAF